MLESYIRTGDGEEYVDVNCVREALGIVDEDVDIFGVIKKLKQERDGLKAELELTNRLYKENRDFVDKVCEAVDIQRPYLESGYANAVKLIAEIKKERDELKEKCDKMKKRANAVYGVSCGKEPAFLCDVISYSWSFGAIDTPFSSNSIRVELSLTPTANYKGTFDLEDLKKYIQAYGREKKLGIIESVDYQNAKVARAELAYLYKKVLGKEKLDPELSPHEVMKAILNEYTQREEFVRALSCSLGFGYPVVKPDSIDQKEKDILERVEGLKSGVWPCENSSTFAENLRKEFPKFCKEYDVAPIADESSVRDWIRYIFGVLSDYRFIANGWDGPLGYKSLKEFLNDVCEILDIPSSMADDHKQVRKEIHDFADRYYELRDFRADICEVLGIDADELFGSPRQNDKYILEQVKKLKESAGHDKLFRDSVCDALDTMTAVSDSYLFKNIEKLKLDHKEIQEKYSRYCLAIGSLCNIPAEHREDISWIEDSFNHTKKDYLKWQATTDRLARLRSDICTALSLGHEDCDGNIIGRIHMMQDCHEKLCKDYTDLRKAIWEAMDKKTETLPGDNEKLLKEVAELKSGEKLLIEFRDGVAEAIGMEYPTTNTVILNSVQYIYKDRKDAYGMVAKLNDRVRELENANENLKQKFEFQSGLRQQWHARYESEHERANGVQKALDREREKCRVKDISLETAKKQYEKVCSNLETAECALNGMKSKVRSLQEEKTKVISALGQDIWDDCLK